MEATKGPSNAVDDPGLPRSIVESLCEELKGRVRTAHDMQSMLEDRLTNVLQPVPGASGATQTEGKEGVCALANELFWLIGSVQALVVRQQGMLERVQV